MLAEPPIKVICAPSRMLLEAPNNNANVIREGGGGRSTTNGRTNSGINIGTAVYNSFEDHMPTKMAKLTYYFGPKRGDYKGIDNFKNLIKSELNEDFREALDKHVVRRLIVGDAYNKPALMNCLAPLRQGSLTGLLNFMTNTPPQ